MKQFGDKALKRYKVAVVGGGSSGISVTAQLYQHYFPKIEKSLNSEYESPFAIIEPNTYHYYQPLWTLAGAGLKTFDQTKKQMKQVIDVIGAGNKLQWIQKAVMRIDPENNQIHFNDEKIEYDYLVLAAGIECKWNSIPGLAETLGKDEYKVTSNYHPDSVQKTAQFIKEFKGGNAIFTQPSTPIKCPGAPQKIMYLAEEQWRLNGCRNNTNVIFNTGAGKIFAVDKYAKELYKICKDRNITVNTGHELIKIVPEKKIAVFKVLADGKTVETPFDFIHVTPHMGPPGFIKSSDLSNGAGFAEVHNKTLQHVKYKNIFALGDCSSLPVSKTASAVAAENGVVAKNLSSQLEADLKSGEKPGTVFDVKFEEYDGYTSCPLITGKGKLILAEFNGFTLEPKETFWFDQSKERSSMYALKSDILPSIYWDLMLKGNWNGPKPYRKFFNPFNKN